MSANRTRKNRVDGGDAVHLSNLKIINGCIVFDVCSGTFHRVSETAAFIINELKQQTPASQIIVDYSQRYGIPRAIAARDVELFMNDISVTA